jgi:hypothetical protein
MRLQTVSLASYNTTFIGQTYSTLFASIFVADRFWSDCEHGAMRCGTDCFGGNAR